ncbi:heparan-alpha-glucosaminide N-acetyltransferase [Rhizobium sp. SL86]|uniref:heparan-alpha-glucosaminide N-acetyltransferase n=1 Tax=Rhizobium sp. SL86 TaxID=2995148 RepID=UPI0022762C0B|nr:heparan-alpha-glucosaminide N-acetyltransferase [Rhizobium sp. SL86]MCY1668692.1 heparan-alpha-glucosaminide N-acetyltransferase [Rhizobium sp. SL86]
MFRTPRIPLIDTLRGIALVAMASYHFTWDLEFFGYLEPGTATEGGWKIYARLIASSFLFLVGVSLVLAHRPAIRWKPYVRRLGMVAAAAAVISVGTYVALPQEWIFFGILHAIVVSSLIALLFLPLPPLVTAGTAIAILVAFIIDGWVMPGVVRSALFDSRLIAWIGLAETPPRSNDFVPLFPWLSAVLAGVAVAGLLRRHGGFARLQTWQRKENILTRAGQHSLAFYLVHQPVLIGIVYLATLVAPPPAPDPIAGYNRSCQATCTAGGNDAGLCQRFCACTADRLVAQSLFQPMQKGEINPSKDQRVLDIAGQCTAISMEN